MSDEPRQWWEESVAVRRPEPIRALPDRVSIDTAEGARTGLLARIVIATTVVFGQLWAIVVGLDRYLVGRTGQAWILFGFSAASFLVVLALTVVEPASRRDLRRRSRRTQAGGLYQPEPVPTEKR